MKIKLLECLVLFLIICSCTTEYHEPNFQKAIENGQLANEGYVRCNDYLEAWLKYSDPITGLIPKNLNNSKDFWNAKDAAADNYPFMVLTSAIIDEQRLHGRMLDMLLTETKLTSRLGHLPDTWSFSHGAAFLVQALTAYYGMVDLGRLQKGETVLIHSAAGGVGIQANRIAKKFDAYTIGSVGSDHKLKLLDEEGYDKGIVRSDSFREDLRSALGDRNLDVIMECIGGKILLDSFKELGLMGRMVVYGSASFTTPGDKPNKIKMLLRWLKRPKIDPMLLPNSNKTVVGFNLIWLYPQIEKYHRIVRELNDLALPEPIIGESYAFEDLPKAIRKLQSGMTIGKVVVVV